MKHVVIVDYKISNLDSVKRAFERCGAEVSITETPEGLKNATHIVLPGVGAFTRGMANLKSQGLDTALINKINQGTPCLGICLGMHLLANTGTEGQTETKGLGLIPGRVERLVATSPSENIPHVGWNEVQYEDGGPLLEGIPSARDYYFVHSYHFLPDDKNIAVATTPYCGNFASVVHHGIVFGVQFHPEKSQRWGLKLLENFLQY